jgi:hypothetical protein
MFPLKGHGVPPFQENPMLRKSQANPAPVCVLLGGPKAAASAQDVCVLLRRQPTPYQSPSPWLVARTALNHYANGRVWGMTDKLRFFLFG